MNLSLKRKTDAVPLCSKILLKHASDALKLIRRELDPFRTYGYNPHVAFQQMGSGRSITIYTSKMSDPLDTRLFTAEAVVYLYDEEVWIEGHGPSELICNLPDLTPEKLCKAFCDVNADEIKTLFLAICDYHEGAKAIRHPF